MCSNRTKRLLSLLNSSNSAEQDSQHALSSNFQYQSSDNLTKKVIVETIPQISEIRLVPKIQVQVSEKERTKVSVCKRQKKVSKIQPLKQMNLPNAASFVVVNKEVEDRQESKLGVTHAETLTDGKKGFGDNILYNNPDENRVQEEEQETEIGVAHAKNTFDGEDEVSDDKDLNYSPDESGTESEQNNEKRNAVQKINKPRKRVRKVSEWKESKRRESKVKGKEYKSTKGHVKRARVLQISCKCKRKCYNSVDQEQSNLIFKAYYGMSRHAQDQLLSETIEERLKDRERLTQEKNKSRRQFSRKYFLKNREGNRIEVCQVMYLNTFDISIKKVRVISEKKRVNNGFCPPDGRGKHGKQPKINELNKNFVREHINSFPAYTSHYSREKTSKKYLNPDLSIAEMYRLYLKQCEGSNLLPLKEFQYRKIFNEEFNLAFHHPANDTCAKCDRLNLALKSIDTCINLTEDQLNSKQQIKGDLEEHLDMAKKAYENKDNDKQRSKLDPTYVTISFDLEKCLPTPYLRNGVSFYKTQLWVYNLTVYKTDTTGNEATCLLWNETIAGRGGQEIASCIRKFILSLDSKHIEILNFYSDSCTGQNRNIYMAIMFCNILKELPVTSSIVEINHKFLEPGHTHMEADTIHAAIERAKKKTAMDIEVPHDWTNFIKTSVYRKKPMNVTEMSQTEFMNFAAYLKSSLVFRKKNDDGNPVPWMQIKHMKFRKDLDFKFLYKSNFDDGEFKKVDLRRGSLRNRQRDKDCHLKPLNKQPLPLSSQKHADLIGLLPYVSEYNKPFYQNLNSSGGLDPEDFPALEDEL